MKSRTYPTRLVLIAMLTLARCAFAESSQDATAGEVFATIDDGIVISRVDFEREVWNAARQTYYHGRPPGGDALIEFRKTVAEQLIDRQLLLREAKRRDLEPDRARVDGQIAVYEQRYGDTERWQREGERMMTALRERFEQESLLDRLESEVRSVDKPDTGELRAFYDENPDLFTEPAQNRVQLILLAVPPSSPPTVWAAAREEAARITARADAGTEFSELARMHSADATAEEGGDMGYLHAGMLSGNAEAAITALELGEISEPVQVLEGIALFRLTDQKPEELRPFEDVEGRAADLWLRDRGEQRWSALIAELRRESTIFVDTEYLTALPGSAD